MRGMGRGRLVSFINVTVFRDLFTFELLRRRIARYSFIRPRAVYYDASKENAPVASQFRLPSTAAKQFTQPILVDRSNFKLITQLANVEMQRGQVIGQFVLFWATIKGAAAGFQLLLKFKMSQLALYNFIIYNFLQINLRNIVIFHCWQIPG